MLVSSDRDIKLADFGAARPITESSKLALKEMGNMLNSIHCGHWKGGGRLNVDIDLSYEDDRIEGTKAYLPPECILHNKHPDQSADSWSLGCVIFQSLTAKLPTFNISVNDNEQSKSISFKSSNSQSLLYGHVVSTDVITPSVRDLLQNLLNEESSPSSGSERWNTHQILTHDFFASTHPIEYLNPKNQNGKPSSEGGAWARRQYSSIWAPLQPSIGGSNAIRTDDDADSVGNIPEGAESGCYFRKKVEDCPLEGQYLRTHANP